MAKGINKVILVGFLGQPPEMKYTQSGSAIAVISVATTESWKDKNTGEKQEKTEWHRVVAFNRLAEIFGQYLVKGSQVYIEGQLRTRKYQTQNQEDRYITEIVASEMQMLGRSSDGSQNTGTPAQQAQPQQQGAQAQPQRTAPQPQGAQGSATGHAQPSPYSQVPHAQNGSNQAPAPAIDQFDDDIPF